FAIAAEMARLRGDPQATGREVDLSATEALLRILDPLPVEHEQLGLVRHAVGNLTTYTSPSNMYRSNDGVYFSLVASSQAVYERLCKALEHPEWIDDARFQTLPKRVQHMGELDGLLARWFSERAFEEICTRLQPFEIPFSKVYDIEDIKADPHFQARDAIIRLPDPDYGSLPAPCVVPRIVRRDMPTPRSGPAVGEHNAEIYAELGLTGEQLDELRAQRII